MTDTYSDFVPKPSRTVAVRLAGVTTVTSILWSESATLFYDILNLIPRAMGICPKTGCGDISLTNTVGTLLAALLFAGIGFWAAFYIARTVRSEFLRSSEAKVKRNHDAPPKRGLVLALSDLRAPKRDDDVDDLARARTALVAARAADTPEARRILLDDLCSPTGSYAGWKWQQPLRLLKHNMANNTLQIMVFILSREAAPQYRDMFEPLLKLLKPELIVLPEPHTALVEANQVNHSNYESVGSALDKACGMAMTTTGCTLGDLCVDITSGTKAYSAAATVKTLNSAAVFSYVENSGEVVIYDAAVTG